jgi:hypothetical protein
MGIVIAIGLSLVFITNWNSLYIDRLGMLASFFMGSFFCLGTFKNKFMIKGEEET